MHIKILICAVIILFIGGSSLPSISGDIEKLSNISYENTLNVNDGLVGYWSFDDINDVGHDDSNNGHQGVNHGATSVTGISKNALEFDGSNDYVEIPDTSDFEFTDQSVTYSAWVQIVDNPNQYRVFVILRDSDDQRPDIGLGKWRNGNNEGRIFIEIINEEVTHCVVSDLDGDNLPKNEWIFLTGVIDKENNKIKLYVNGVLQQDQKDYISYDMANAESLKLFIGKAEYFNWPGYHRGLIDEVRIYGRALTEQEILELYNEPFKIYLFVGKIRNLKADIGSQITFEAEKLRIFESSPFQFIQYSSGEKILVLDKYLGILTPSFAFGFFKAII